MILPMPIATDEVEPFIQKTLFLGPVEEPPPLMPEAADVRVVVRLAITVRSDHRRRGDDDLERRVRFQERSFQPVALCLAPDGFLRAVR